MWIVPTNHPLHSAFVQGYLDSKEALRELSGGGLRVATYVEIEAFIIANLVSAMEAGFLDPVPIWTDVKTFNPYPFRNKIHVIIGGYPCQPFSTAGKREGEDDHRHLWPHIYRCIQVIRPLCCFFENVSGHLSMGYETVKGQLEAAGYRVKEGIYSAAEVGASHRRERLFILAVANTHCDGPRTIPGNNCSKSSAIKSKEQWEEWYKVFWQWMWTVLGNCSSSLANPADPGLQSRRQIEQWKFSTKTFEGSHNRFKQSSAHVADTASCRGSENSKPGELRGDRTEQSSRHSGSTQKNETGQGPEIPFGSDKLSMRACLHNVKSELFEIKMPRMYGDHDGNGDFSQWPAGPGPCQHEWEEPRTIEPGLGCTTDGYNFRTDLLRAYGNAVVEQVAEIAFIDLMRKHFEDAG